ncbi:MAG: bacteriocin family protein [Candidatus Coatesbacteria bacterium]|nr:bacteriocin family protein [Candidatus Coatesbacteria bacterium]
MSSIYLHRKDAPFGDDVWRRIDETVVSAARSQLTGRRLLALEGPYGLGVKALSGKEKSLASDTRAAGAALGGAEYFPLLTIRVPFAIPIRDVASFEKTGVPFDISFIAEAATACASLEDQVIFSGSKEAGILGLLHSPGSASLKLSSWESIGVVADDVISAVTKLDDAGFHGPYALALAPKLYNILFRRYPQGNMTELDHIKSIITAGLIKGPAVKSGGVLIAAGAQFASLALGQDLMTGFVGPSGGDYEFTLSETLTLIVRQPGAICVLKQ